MAMDQMGPSRKGDADTVALDSVLENGCKWRRLELTSPALMHDCAASFKRPPDGEADCNMDDASLKDLCLIVQSWTYRLTE